jgi:hypothetical protein
MARRYSALPHLDHRHHQGHNALAIDATKALGANGDARQLRERGAGPRAPQSR